MLDFFPKIVILDFDGDQLPKFKMFRSLVKNLYLVRILEGFFEGPFRRTLRNV